ncbi:radical SAM protein [bacterium]|nr:radical SAM protein [bacterium]
MSRSKLSNTLLNQLQPKTKSQTVTEPKVDLRPSALSVDVVNICNLHCKHCFWDSYDDVIPNKINLNILESVKKALIKFPSITNITWYGGEPLVNEASRKIVQNGIGLNKKNNLVVTNGILPLPEWRNNTHFAVSIDGTQKEHDFIRGKGNYEKSKINILKALSKNIPVAVIYCINALNIHCLPDFLAEWSDYPLEGIVFTMYAPLKNNTNNLQLTDRQRDMTSDLLLRLKQKYSRPICNSHLMLELLKNKYGQQMAANCPMDFNNVHSRVYSVHMCNDGSLRSPCALGENADCQNCRSVTKIALYAGVVMHDRTSINSLLRMYHSKHHTKHAAVSNYKVKTRNFN